MARRKNTSDRKSETARHLFGDTSGYTAFLSMPGWPLELKVGIYWRIYSADQSEMIQHESNANLFPKSGDR